MAWTELNPKYVISSWEWLLQLQTDVNKLIEKWYVPFGHMILKDTTFLQVMIDPKLLEVVVKNEEGKNFRTTIPTTVNVSWCECNCW